MKFIQKKHDGLPLKCDCCEKIIYYQGLYKVLTYNELEISLTTDCCENFIKELSCLIDKN